jgi:hypothetical protein
MTLEKAIALVLFVIVMSAFMFLLHVALDWTPFPLVALFAVGFMSFAAGWVMGENSTRKLLDKQRDAEAGTELQRPRGSPLDTL